MSKAILEGVFLKAAEACTDDAMRSALAELADRHDCSSGNVMTVGESSAGDLTFGNFHNMPASYLESFFDFEEARRDPVMRHVKRSSLPILWTRRNYIAVDQERAWEHMAACGLASGAAVAVHMPDGRHVTIGLDRRGELPQSSRRLTRLLGEMQLFLAHITESAFAIHESIHRPQAGAKSVIPKLTPRELEALGWTIDGKTAWEIGQIMGITERGAVKHLANATCKLGCVNKAQAVIRAVRVGLI
jgi:DNA-binding CsgD family transcriptional regulator